MENIRQSWEDLNQELCSFVDSSTINTAQIDVGDLENTSNRYTYLPVKTQDVTVLVSCEFGEENFKHDRKCQIKKVFWRPKRIFDFVHSAEKNIIYLEGSEDYLGFTGEAVATMNLWPDIWGRIEDHVTVRRGVYAPKYKRKVIFSKSIRLKTSDLPRWKPTAIIGKQNYEVDDVQ